MTGLHRGKLLLCRLLLSQESSLFLLLANLLLELSLLALHLITEAIHVLPESEIIMQSIDIVRIVVSVWVTEPIVRCLGPRYTCSK